MKNAENEVFGLQQEQQEQKQLNKETEMMTMPNLINSQQSS